MHKFFKLEYLCNLTINFKILRKTNKFCMKKFCIKIRKKKHTNHRMNRKRKDMVGMAEILQKSKTITLLLIVGVVYFFLEYISPLVAPVLVAFLFVTIFGPFLQRLQRKLHLHRQVGAVLLLVIFSVLLLLLLYDLLMLPYLHLMLLYIYLLFSLILMLFDLLFCFCQNLN